jgi:uncharacterized phosphosugar-binding protein
MKNAAALYLDVVRQTLDFLEESQMQPVTEAADLIVHALLNRGAIFCAEIGHANQMDFIQRAGGLACVQRFDFKMHVQSHVAQCLKDRPRPEPLDENLEQIRAAVRTSNLRAGDVLLVSSVSGKNKGPVELALACREIGVKVIGFTSLTYTAKVESQHPSGKRLAEAVDVVLDNGAPYGDATVDIPGYDNALMPISGVSMITLGWMLWGSVMEKMAAAGHPASVYISFNREGGVAALDAVKQRFEEKGY